MVAPGRGILAADESNSTMAKRLEGVGVESTEESRRRFRELLFTTPEAERHISGVILYDETLRQQASDGTPIPELLAGRDMIPGIKVDTGAKPLAARTARSDRGPRRPARAPGGVPRSGARALPSGAPSSPSARACRATTASPPTRTRWGATPPLPGGGHRADRRAEVLMDGDHTRSVER